LFRLNEFCFCKAPDSIDCCMHNPYIVLLVFHKLTGQNLYTKNLNFLGFEKLKLGPSMRLSVVYQFFLHRQLRMG
jgi:hypothetical protein